MKDKPETTPWFKYYIGDPLTDLGEAIVEKIHAAYIKVTGKWYCEYCGKYHSCRVHKHTVQFTSRALGDNEDGVVLHHIGTVPTEHRCICSLACQAYKENRWKPKYYREWKDIR